MVLLCCAGSEWIQLGKPFHCQIIILGIEFDVVLQTGLLDFYEKVGDPDRIFAEMPERDVVANNAMIAGFSKLGCVDRVKELFDSMPVRDTLLLEFRDFLLLQEGKEYWLCPVSF